MSTSKSPLVAFMVLQVLGGHVGMSIMLLTIFTSRKIARHSVFINFCMTWVLFSLSYTLLLYTGQINNPFPNFTLCLIQSAMIYGSPAMGSISVLMFVLHLYLILRESINKTPPRWPKLRLISMLAAPYVAFLVVFTAVIFSGNKSSSKVHRSTFYCTIDDKFIKTVAAGIPAVGILLSLSIETLTAMTLHRHWKTFRNQKTSLNSSILIRTLIVLIVSVIALFTSMAFLTNLTSTVPNFVLASIPLCAFLVFGTQHDFLQVWFFCRRERSGTGDVEEKSQPSMTDTSVLMVKKV